MCIVKRERNLVKVILPVKKPKIASARLNTLSIRTRINMAKKAKKSKKGKC